MLIHASHRLETLAARLADEMRQRPGDPLLAERIVVPHPTLGQWLRLQLATQLGIAAHLRIELPAEFAWAAMREAVPALSAVPVFEPAYLRWRIFERLGRWDSDDEIARYLADGDSRKRFELADRLAIAYDRCLVFRSDSIRAWQAGESPQWHGRLWAELAADHVPGPQVKGRHWIDALDVYRNALIGPTARPRVSFFAVATMSPSFLEMLHLASAVMDIHLFLLSPRRDFWTHVPSRKAGGYYAENNELLEAWGRPARDMQALLRGQQAAVVADQPAAHDQPSADTCLGTLQADIFGAPAPSAQSAPPAPLAPDDSIQVHVCHSPAREVEVLHDRLLGVFDQYPDIQPADVLVLTPDLDTYAPIIAAVFGAAGRIRFQIGRRRFNEGAALTAFLDLLELPGSRYTANAVLAPLRAASVRACFGIGEHDLEGIRDAVRRAGIRWGLDAAHRTELDVPASPNHNWHHGLRRLLLGYAIDADADVLLDNITPCALDRWGFRTGAADYERLGRFLRYCELTFALDDWSQAAHRPSEWATRLRTDVLARFFGDADRGSTPEVSRELSTVARLIDAFAAECDHAGTTTPVPFEVLRDVLREHAAATTRGVPRLADGVTVTGLTLGQALPAKVVCAVGMNDGAFPRRPPATPFEFLTRLFGEDARQLGDRDVRDDDRFAFLEAVLAARRYLLLTYTGRDLQEDKPTPPSVVVSELTEYLDRRFPDAAGKGDPGRWQTRHPLQPFSPRYFRPDEPALFSYSAPMAAAATALGAAGGEPDRFGGELGATPTAPEIELEDLIRFAVSPAKHFARRRLGLHLDVRDDELADDEPFHLDALQAWQLKSDLADWGKPSEVRAARLAAASGLLPPGNMADIQHRESAGEVARLQEALQPYEDHNATAEVDAVIHDSRVVGVVKLFHGEKNELVWWRIGAIRAKDRIAVWLRLLALTGTLDRRLTAYLFGSKNGESSTLAGPSPERARALLGDWVTAWHEGQRRPLPFFAETSWAWAAKQSSTAVASAWSGMPWSEGNDAVHQMIFGDNPVDDSFKDLASHLLGPLREATS